MTFRQPIHHLAMVATASGSVGNQPAVSLSIDYILRSLRQPFIGYSDGDSWDRIEENKGNASDGNLAGDRSSWG